MYTRCPECDSTHRVNAALLAQSRGMVRCGHCRRKFDALEALFDEWPDAGDPPPPAGSRYRPPVLGDRDSLSMPFGPATVHQPGKPRRQAPWWVALALLLAVTAAHTAFVFRDSWIDHPWASDWLQRVAGYRPAPEPAFRAPGDIQVVSRDLHSHPTLAGVLVLSATIANRAGNTQPMPVLLLTLRDIDGNAVAERRFRPSEYVPGGVRAGASLPADAHAPVLLEFLNPGPEAVGFEIDFL